MNRPNALSHIRQIMRENHIHAYLIPTADPHLSEYLPDHWKAREWLSGFTGSAGTLLICTEDAALWTDSRYWEQAEQQLSGSLISLKKQGIDPEPADYLAQILPENATVAIDADMLSVAAQKRFQAAFSSKNIQLHTQIDLLKTIWQDRPTLPQAPIYPHVAEYVCESSAEKLARVRQIMQQNHADHHLISSLDDIAWLTHLRGSDVPYNPVFLAYFLISAEGATLFTDLNKLGDTEKNVLKQAQIDWQNYHDLPQALATLSGSLMIDSNKTAVATLNHLNQQVKIIDQANPSSLFKAQKSPAEIAHIRQAMRQDGAALCGFFAELERDLATGQTLTELDIATRLTDHRSQRPHYVSPSFNTIAGFRGNGAYAHYAATPESHSTLMGNGLLLIDSGAQYHYGTTDITRVIAIGNSTENERIDFTLVLKAHIALANAVFPENISGSALDAICRAPLWQTQRDYGHGTGHGVGYFLNVHEFPATIAYRAAPNPHNILKEGQLVSNEPALYRSGQYGIRIENLVLCQTFRQPEETEFGKFLCFETMTLCPIDTRLIELNLLNETERHWLNQYHERVRDELLPLLHDDLHQQWLLTRTQSI